MSASGALIFGATNVTTTYRTARVPGTTRQAPTPFNEAICNHGFLQRICGPPVGELRMPDVLWDKQHEHDAQELYNYTHGEQMHLRIRPVGKVFMTEHTLHDTTFVSKSGLVVPKERPFLGASLYMLQEGHAGDKVPIRVKGGIYQHRAQHSCVLSWCWLQTSNRSRLLRTSTATDVCLRCSLCSLCRLVTYRLRCDKNLTRLRVHKRHGGQTGITVGDCRIIWVTLQDHSRSKFQ